MKRLCPNCRTSNIERTLFSFRDDLNCSMCNNYFKDSLFSRVAIAANILFLLVVGNILTMGYYEFFLVVIYILSSLVMIQSFPVAQAVLLEFLLIPPTDVAFERTNDVNENIKRYKEGQRLAIKYNINNQRAR